MHRLVTGCLALAAALAIAVPEASAQTLGVRGGLSLATLSGEGDEDLDNRTGIAVSGTVTFPLAPTVGLQLGLGYAQKGASVSDPDVDGTFALDYLEVPALVRFDVPTAGTISPRLYLGGALAYETSCALEGEADGFSASIDCDQLAEETGIELQTKSFDIGAVAGAGLSFGTAGPVNITLDIFYNLGLTSIDDSADAEDVKNRAWAFLAGVEFGLGGL